MFKNQVPKQESKTKQQSKKAVSLLVRLCFSHHFQSVVPPSVFVLPFTRLTASFGATFFIVFSSLVAPLCCALDTVKQQTVAHFLAVAQPPAITVGSAEALP